MTWLEGFFARVDEDLGAFLLALGTDALIALVFFAFLWLLIARWIASSHHGIDERELWNEERKASEHERFHAIRRYLRNLSVFAALLLFLSLMALRYEIPLLYEFALSVRTWLVTGGLGSLFLILLAAVAANTLLTIVRRTTRVIAPVSGQRFERQIARATTIRVVIESTLQVVIGVVFVIFALGQLGANIAALLAGVGFLGLAISFGAQSLVKDLISGFFILLEDQYGVDDIVAIGDLGGLVEGINLRITTLRDVEGRVHIIPNGQILQVTVLSKEWSRAVMDIEVAYRTDLEQALGVVRDEALSFYEDESWLWRIIEPPEVLGVEALGASGIVLRTMFKTLPKEQWNVAREFRKRIKARFDSEGIEIPFPHLTFYWGEAQMPTPPREREIS
jgi:moderate conductance mechanosensitive channel